MIWSLLFALGFGLLSASVSNRDSVHRVLRNLGITHQTSYASEWYGARSRGSAYVVLHLPGERRLYGWPEEWPSTPGKGHFVIIQGEWLSDSEATILPPENKLLIAAEDVEMVELIPHQTLTEEIMKDGSSQSTDTSTHTTSGTSDTS